jgi:hypothetical protein
MKKSMQGIYMKHISLKSRDGIWMTRDGAGIEQSKNANSAEDKERKQKFREIKEEEKECKFCKGYRIKRN